MPTPVIEKLKESVKRVKRVIEVSKEAGKKKSPEKEKYAYIHTKSHSTSED